MDKAMDPKLKTCNGIRSSTDRTCRYDNATVSAALRKGSACFACRRKKKKCDGHMPCYTCANGRKEIDCKYPEEELVTLSQIPDTRSGSFQWALRSSIKDLSGNVIEPPSQQRAANGSTRTSDSAVPRVHPPTFDQSEIAYFTESPPQGGSSALNSPSPFFEMTSPAMVPEAEEQDEELLEHIRKIFLAHRFQVGFSVPDETLEAISQGVIEGTHLQPEVLHACQLMGSLFARHLQNNAWLPLPGQSKGEAKQLRLTLFFLQTALPVPLPHLQAKILLSLYFSIKGELLRAQEVLATANKVVVEHKLDAALLQRPNATAEILSKRTFTPVPVTPAAEIRATLSHLVYLDLSHMIFLKLPSVLDPELYASFRRIATIPAADAEINFVRAKSAVLMFEAQKLAEQWYRFELGRLSIRRLRASHSYQLCIGDDGAAAWQEKYWELMEAIETHRCAINLALTRTVFCPELKIVGLTLKMCSIIVHTGLSILLALFSPHHVELRRKQHDVVAEIVSISASYSEEDCEYLDPMVSACWTVIIGMMDELALGPDVCPQFTHEFPAMAAIIRARSQTLQRVLPFALSTSCDASEPLISLSGS
ncbi:hypothetical protein C8R43DRAFT_948132 [Mycena crocata]|nr:hypothetical protein C8R43DRAFT_948132 [Mycena crocata]